MLLLSIYKQCYCYLYYYYTLFIVNIVLPMKFSVARIWMEVPIHSNWHILVCILFVFEQWLITSATKDPSSLLGSLVKLCVYCYIYSFFFMTADDEDIPANFSVEDNDLPEDDDLPEDEPVRKRRLLFYTLEKKKLYTRHTLSLAMYDWLHGNGEFNLCRYADGGYNCRQMLYCLPIHILAQ